MRFPTAANCPWIVCSLLLCVSGVLGQTMPAVAGPAVAGVVVVVDGSAGLRPMAEDLRHAVADAGLPLQVTQFSWSHGIGRVFADIHGHGHHAAKGKELASFVLERRQSCPEQRIDIVCHSSGAAVVLAAAESLPPDAVDRIILLAPYLSPKCDLCAALRCSREGVDCFYSSWDMISRMTALIGTADGSWQMSAGCVGFTPVHDPEPVRALYLKLHQHPWGAEMKKAGHTGGHFGCARLEFFRQYILPLL